MSAKRKKDIWPKDIDDLYKAVQAYVENRGGQILVIGGIQLQQWPGEGEYKFTIGVQVTGRRPALDADSRYLTLNGTELPQDKKEGR